MMKILYLTTVLPSKKRGGGEIASQSFIDALKQSGHEVLIVGYQRKNDVLEKNSMEISVGERYIETDKAKFYPILWLGLSLVKGFPYSSAKYYSGEYIRKVKALLSSDRYEAIIIDHAQLGWLEPLINEKDKLIFIEQNIEHELYQQQFEKAYNYISKLIYKREARLIKNMEDQLAKAARQVWALTEYDFKYFLSVKKEGRVIVHDVPSSVGTLPDTPATKNCDIGIIGSWTWKANSLGLEWFFQAVYLHLPTDLSIRVAGKGAEWLQGQYSNVNYCGFVPNAPAFMGEAKVIAIPSISGSGIQIKTLDAIASGKPIVATPVALRGISDYPRSVRVAEKPEDFAHSLIQLLTLPTAEDFCEDAITWSQNRREKFVAGVAAAINTIQTAKV